MSFNIDKSATLTSEISMKCPKGTVTKQYFKEYLLQNYDLYDLLFSSIKNESAFYLKPEPLRHPLIFYYGHTASFFINKLVDQGIIENQINDVLEAILAVGVDQMDWDDLDKTQYNWPTLQQVKNYRKLVRQKLVEVLDKIQIQNISWNSDIWSLCMGLDHEKIHFETSSAIIRRLPIQEIEPSSILIDCPIASFDCSYVCQNQLKTVPSCKYKWDRTNIKSTDYFGWDNQFGDKIIDVPQFKASKMLVSNGQFLEFVKDGGYQNEDYWDQEGVCWLKSTKQTKPIFWVESEEMFKLRTMNRIIPLPMDWPVQVNNLQATAFCNWKGKKLNKTIRLPTEEQYHALRQMLPFDHFDWITGKTGNINLEVWNSPCPVNMFETNGFYDIIGNVWQHTCTPLYPFKGFQIHPLYEDYSSATFDGRHFIIKGGSFATIGNLSTKHARDAFRRHFHQFAGFRYVESPVEPTIPKVLLDENDQIVERFLKVHYQQNGSYVHHCSRLIKQICADKDEKFLNVGCSVGSLVLQMSKYFKKSYGTDFSARFFQMASRILDKGILEYKDISITTEKIHPIKENIMLYQVNPENPDPNKINGFKVVVIDGLVLKENKIKRVLSKFLPLMVKNSYLLLINSESKNMITPPEMKNIIEDSELINERIVPVEECGQQEVNIALYRIFVA